MLHQREGAILEQIKAYDLNTYKHSIHVAEMAKEFSGYLANQSTITDKKGFVERVYNAAIVHDAGKLTIPYEIINKPGKLTDAERSLMSAHSEAARNVLDGFPETDIRVATEHHYVYGNQKMSLEAQIIAVCDVYSAITLERSYSPAHTPSYAINEMQNCRQLNRDLIDLFDNFLRDAKYYEQGLPADYYPPTYDDYIQHSLYYLSSKYKLSPEYMRVDHYNGSDFIVYNDNRPGARESVIVGTLRSDGTIDMEPHEIKMLHDEPLFQKDIDWSKYEDPTIKSVDEYESMLNAAYDDFDQEEVK